MGSVKKCLLCNTELNGEVFSLGNLPACNSFHSMENDTPILFPLSVIECKDCSLIQLFKIPSIPFLMPQFPWIKYNEPEDHLTKVAITLSNLLKKASSVLGIAPFDHPLLIKLKEQNHHCQSLDLRYSFQELSNGKFPYLETIQSELSMVQTSKNLQQNGKFHLIVCRYLLEHSHNPVEALQSLKHLIHLDGFLLIEVPDNTKFLQCKDYSFIWEEHITYFNEYTLENLLSVSGYEMVVVLKFTGKLEDALVAIVKPSSNPQLDFKKNTPISRFDEYRNSFEDIKKNYITQLEKMKKNGDIIVIFGAGHQSIMFINALKLVPYISFIIDDDINKQGYFSPGSNIPIVDSSILLGKNSDINVCLLAVSPKLEEKIQAKLKPFTKRSGKLYTIFPGSNMPTIFEDNICN